MKPKPISIQMYTVRDLTKTREGFIKTIEEIAKIGYVGLEASHGPLSPQEFKKLLDDNGLRLSSTWMEVTAATVNQAVEMAQMHGIKHFAGCWMDDKLNDRASTLACAAHFQKQAELLKPHGLEFVYHNHWHEFVKLEDGRYIWDVLLENAPDVRCEIDLYWASNFGAVDVPAVVRKYAKRAPLLHVKDGPLIKNQPNTAVGKGKMHFQPCFDEVDDSTTQWLIVELDHYVKGNQNMMEAVRDSYQYLTSHGHATGRK